MSKLTSDEIGRRIYLLRGHRVMLASVLNSPQAVKASVMIVRTFVRMRRFFAKHRGLDNTYNILYNSTKKLMMTLTASQARAKLFKLLSDAAETHHPIQITSKRGNAVLIAQEDWQAIQETLYLLSIPGMRASIRRGLAAPVKKCSDKLRW